MSIKMIIHLVMMVKDCDTCITKTLSYARPYVDKITILDTGSTDCTISILKKMDDVDLYQCPFVDFAVSRNKALDLAGDDSDYIIMLDDSFLLYGGDKLRKLLTRCLQHPDKSYGIMIKDKDVSYYSIRIFKTKYHLRYKYPVHEVIDSDSASNIVDKDIYLYDDHDSDAIKRSISRYPNDIITLTTFLEDHPNNTRALFYLGMSHASLKHYSEAIKYFKQRISIDQGFKEEIFISLYNIANITCVLKEKWNKVHSKYIKAYNYFPHRCEPLFKIGSHYFNQHQYSIAFIYLNAGFNLPVPKDLLYVEYKIYDFYLPLLLCTICINVKRLDIGLQCLTRLNDKYHDDDKVERLVRIYQQLQSVLTTPVTSTTSETLPVVVIVTGYYFFPWCPNTELIRGSEIVPVMLGKELVKLNYQVYIFAQCKDDSVDYTGIYGGVNFRDLSEYHDFIKNNHINFLIVSRYTRLLTYYPNIDNVYLWLHDPLPMDDKLSINENKFKGVLCLCQSHKEIFCNKFNFPKDLVYITSNAIDPERFNGHVKKQKYRFIYSSNPVRGLKYLIKVFPRIQQKYPQSQLHIYCSFDYKLYGSTFWNELDIVKQLVDDNPFVINHGCVNQYVLAQEFMKSHVWFHPTDYYETYCITALEAQMARTLCITTNLGALSEVVSDRGILIEGSPTTDQYMDTALSKLFEVLDNPQMENTYLEKGYQWAITKSFKNLAQQWSKQFLKL